ncbi:MAG: hypothetical protein QF362_00320 [Candidatus Woesearchaeota archaeon]|jgi:hypothetical protein|nr:hypothetical protein [Candidatus Woesearchaeota archaeon]MDP7505874.1 hypothetical protein [Candidatus Woesearchaeota archaeon]MDP7610335.1 hypothetical protein [Candidatus Woesearchaeota archaeon]|tara:strand:+ start:916 stop:1926 length:1011 start_codon:yes stop_codon:yes gene_type:complete
MIDIKKDFEDGFNLLMKHKKIMVPVLFSIVVPLILISLFFSLSGVSPLLRELASANEDFDKEKTDYLLSKENIGTDNYSKELINYLGKDSESSTYNDDFEEYLEGKGYDWSRYKELLNAKNVVMGIVFVLLSMISSFYFSSKAYLMIALAIKKKKSNNLLRMTNRFMLKFFSMRVLIGFIVFIPAMVLAGLGGMLFFVNEILGILSIFLFIILFFGYLIFMSLKLFFATPIMFVEEQGPLRSIKQSFQMTKGHLKQVLIILFMIVGITIFINSFVGQPLYNTYLSLFFESNLVKVAINLVLVLFFLMLESFVFTFEYLFLFLSYVDFKRLKKGGKK